jgi:hypothetical protein
MSNGLTNVSGFDCISINLFDPLNRKWLNWPPRLNIDQLVNKLSTISGSYLHCSFHVISIPLTDNGVAVYDRN